MKKLNLLFLIVIIITCSCSKEKLNEFIGDSGTFIDKRDGQVYNWVRIGEQIWMGENLKATKFNDATPIPNITDDLEWRNISTPAYCWYNNDKVSYKEMYGALYNWHAVDWGKLSPEGWHVPSDTEWLLLETFLGGNMLAGGKLKEAGTDHWLSPNEGATNISGFTALPTGMRYSGFDNVGQLGGFWSSTPENASYAWGRSMSHDYANILKGNGPKATGMAVRCIKD